MPWVTRGMRDGLLTSSWPKRGDEYFNNFPAAVTVRESDPDAETDPTRTDPAVQAAVAGCPTQAISNDGGSVQLDRGRCILCGRCIATAPDVFAWQHGSAVARLDRTTLVVGDTPDSDEALSALRSSLESRVRRLRRSVHVRHVDAGSDGSDEWEVQALTNPVYDLHRLGIFFTASPRHADILLVTGIGTAEMVEPLHRTRRAMPDPVVVIAAGADAISGGLIGRGYTSGHGIGGLLDVDVWVPGSPPTPFALLHAILLALGRVPPAAELNPATGGR